RPARPDQTPIGREGSTRVVDFVGSSWKAQKSGADGSAPARPPDRQSGEREEQPRGLGAPGRPVGGAAAVLGGVVAGGVLLLVRRPAGAGAGEATDVAAAADARADAGGRRGRAARGAARSRGGRIS